MASPPFSAKVRIVLAEKGIAADIAEIPWSRDTLWGPKPQAFLDVSPKGEVSVLEDEDLAIVDSTVINEYLEEAYPSVPLMPETPLERASCRMWGDMADHFMALHINTLIREVFMKPDGGSRDDAAADGALTAFQGYLAALERRLAEHEYLCQSYSSADIGTWLCLTFGQTLGVDFSDLSGVQAWYARVASRPAVAAEVEQIMAAAAVA